MASTTSNTTIADTVCPAEIMTRQPTTALPTTAVLSLPPYSCDPRQNLAMEQNLAMGPNLRVDPTDEFVLILAFGVEKTVAR